MTRQVFLFKWFVYALALLPLCVLQTMVLDRFPIQGVTPVLLPMAAAVVAVLEGPVGGAGYGIYVGAVYEMAVPGTGSLYLLGMCLLGCFVGILARNGLQQGFFGCLLASAGTLVLIDACRIGWRMMKHLAELETMLQVAKPEVLWSLVLFPLVYWIYRAVFRRVGGTSLM